MVLQRNELVLYVSGTLSAKLLWSLDSVVGMIEDAPALSSGSPAFSSPMSLGTDGPKMSKSSRPILGAREKDDVCRSDKARLANPLARSLSAQLDKGFGKGYISHKLEQIRRTGNGGLAHAAFTAGDNDDLLDAFYPGLLRRCASPRYFRRRVRFSTRYTLAQPW